ncbi:TrfB-related DNA-binding protein [Paracidovorax wautersii]|uniref:TrfB-related DNA-binding protein n=1 Tax=Paracidovorax wautersii TaxID=1177982 RepID=UPI0031D03A06
MMTNESFEALSTLLQLRNGPQREAARLVFVEGQKQADAARALGIQRSAVQNTVKVCRIGIERAKKVCESA